MKRDKLEQARQERQRAGGAVSLACLFFILMHGLGGDAPFMFNWVSLGLTAIGAAGILLPVFMPDKEDVSVTLSDEPAIPERDEHALRLSERANQLGWLMPEGGVYDALIKLSRRNPCAALSGAYATLNLLMDQSGLPEPSQSSTVEMELLSGLLDRLDQRCSSTSALIDETSHNALLDTSLKAISYLERIS